MSIKISGLSSIAQTASGAIQSPFQVLMDFLKANYPELMNTTGLTNQRKIHYVGQKILEAQNTGKSLPTKSDLHHGLNQIEADGVKYQQIERDLADLERSGTAKQVAKPTTTAAVPKSDSATPKTQPKPLGVTERDLNVATRPGPKSTAPGLDSTADDIAKSVKSKATTPAPSPMPPSDPRVVGSQTGVKPVDAVGTGSTASNSKSGLSGGNQGKIPTPVDPKPPVAQATTKPTSSLKNIGDEITVITKKPTVATAVVDGTTEGGSVAVSKSLGKSIINKTGTFLEKNAGAGKVLGAMGLAADAALMINSVYASDDKGYELYKYVTRTAGMFTGAKLGTMAAGALAIESGPGALVASAVGGAAGGTYGYIEGEKYGEESFEKLPKGVQDVFNGMGQGISDGFGKMIGAIENNLTPEAIQAKVDSLKETISQILPFVDKESAARLTSLTPDNAVSLKASGINPEKATTHDQVRTFTGQGLDTAEGRKPTI